MSSIKWPSISGSLLIFSASVALPPHLSWPTTAVMALESDII